VAEKYPRQTIFGDKKGNCFATCIAALIGVPVEDVPNFCLEDTWFSDAVNWLFKRGWGTAYFYGDDTKGQVPPGACLYSVLPYIATGPSPRGDFLHSVIERDGKLFHDPHPSDAGLAGPARDYILIFPLPTA
jgi:hypothetical protein